MTSRNLRRTNDLEELVQQSLQAEVGVQQPPRHVWQRIQRELERRTLSRFGAVRGAVLVQVALVMLVVMMSSDQLWRGVSPDLEVRTTSVTFPGPATLLRSAVEYQEEPQRIAVVVQLTEKQEMQLLKQQTHLQQPVKASMPPLVLPPTDVLPHELNVPTKYNAPDGFVDVLALILPGQMGGGELK